MRMNGSSPSGDARYVSSWAMTFSTWIWTGRRPAPMPWRWRSATWSIRRPTFEAFSTYASR